MFRNFSIFTLDPERCYALIANLERDLGEMPFVDCPPQSMESRGFVPPAPGGTELAPVIAGKTVVALLTETKILPAGAVRNAVAKRFAETAERTGETLGVSDRKRIREEVVADLLARALTKRVRTTAYIDPDAGMIIIDSATPRAVDGMIGQLRKAAGRLGANPMTVSWSVRDALTLWLGGRTNNQPQTWRLGDNCMLRVPETGARLSGRGMDLEGDDIKEALLAGMKAQRVAFVVDDACSFTIDEDLHFRRFSMLDGTLAQLPEEGYEDAAAEFAGRFAIASGVIARVIRDIDASLEIVRDW